MNYRKLEENSVFLDQKKLSLIDVYGNEDRYWNLRLIFFFECLS